MTFFCAILRPLSLGYLFGYLRKYPKVDFCFLKSTFSFFLTVRDARNGRGGFTFGYDNNYKVMITMGFWLIICLLSFPSISSVIA